jgi:hypothetical protein
MGVRLYNSTTGLFLSTDPVPGGNRNAYNYPSDPMNAFDLDGRICLCDGLGGPSAPVLGFGGSIERAHNPGPPTKRRPSSHRVHRNSNSYAGVTIGYTITYKVGRGKWRVWKYGISSVGAIPSVGSDQQLPAYDG